MKIFFNCSPEKFTERETQKCKNSNNKTQRFGKNTSTKEAPASIRGPCHY